MPTLSEAKIRASKPRERPYKVFDERGCSYVGHAFRRPALAFPLSTSWVEKLLALGAYPDVLLKRAREKRDEARRVVADGVDPSAKRQAERAASADTFQAIAAG